MERERRKGLAQLFDNLQASVEGQTNSEKLPRWRSSYLARTLAAVDCIKELELKVKSQEEEWQKQVQLNRQLRSTLTLADLTASHVLPAPPAPSLYSCAKCPHVKLPDLYVAFVHFDVCHYGDRSEETQYPEGAPHQGDILSTSSDISSSCTFKTGARGRPKLVTVVKCQDCPMVCLDMDVLRLHKFLHLDLVYLKCADCGFVFGTPSSLKRHMFLQHGTLLQTTRLEESVVAMDDRVALTSKVQTAMSTGDQDEAEVVDNFLSATLDARLVAAEVDLQEEVGSIPINILDTILAKYLGVQQDKIVREKDSTGQDAVKINVEPRHISDPDLALLKANGASGSDPEEIVKREAVYGEEKKLYEELPFAEVKQGLCIKLEPP